MAYTEAAYKASAKYKQGKIKRVPLDMQVTDYEKVKAHAEARSESVNGFIKRSITETMERDNAASDGAGGLTAGANVSGGSMPISGGSAAPGGSVGLAEGKESNDHE